MEAENLGSDGPAKSSDSRHELRFRLPVQLMMPLAKTKTSLYPFSGEIDLR